LRGKSPSGSMCRTTGASVSFHRQSTKFVPDACTEGTHRPCHPAAVASATKSQHGGRSRSTSRVLPRLPEKFTVHPNGLPDGGVGEIQYRSGADVNLIHELPDNAACGVVSPHLLGIEPRQCSDIRKYCPEWIAFVKLGSKHWESSAPEARSRLGTRPYRGPGLCGKDAIRIFT
jgi:hypothetical protein